MSTRETPLIRPPNAGRPVAGRTPRSRVGRRLGAALATSALVAGPLTALAISSADAAPKASATGVLYDGSAQLAAGQIPFTYQSMIAGHVTVVKDPVAGNFNVMRLAVADSDRPYSGASNPRADFETPGFFTSGSDLYYSIKFLIPSGFPTLKSGGFYQISEVYGPPHGGSPPIGIDLFPGAGGRPVVSLQRGAGHGYDRPWTGPTLDTGWHTVYVHTKSAADNTGSVSIWFDGQPQTLTNGSQTINYATLASGVNWDGHTANVLNVNSYRRAGAYPGTVVTYQAAAKVGTTLAAVQDAGNPTTTTTTATTPTTTTTTTTANSGPLSAQFTNPSTSVTGRAVTFDGSGSTGSPVKYVWKDGTATLGTGKSLTFTFHYVGTKHVTLTVTDASGKTASVQHSVSVK
jgi:hypothetical protein